MGKVDEQEEGGSSNDESKEGVEFVLEIDHEKLEKEKKREEKAKRKIISSHNMSDQQFDDVLAKYNDKYKNPPRNASQIMIFAQEINQIFKYKACRIAFNRWKNLRGAVMPQINKNDDEEEVSEPGQGSDEEEEEQERD